MIIKRIERVVAMLIFVLAMAWSGPTYAEMSSQESQTYKPNLSLEIVNVNIMEILKLISKECGLNIVAGKDIQGQVSIFLKDVPVRDGLKTILQSQGLAYYEENSIIKVITDHEYQEKYGRSFSDVRITHSYPIRYTDAEEIASTLNLMKSPSGRVILDARTNMIIVTDTQQILNEMGNVIKYSDRPQATKAIQIKYAKMEDLEDKIKEMAKDDKGHIVIDKRSNKILVTDIPFRVSKLTKMIKALDIKSPQVLIEAKIIEVKLSNVYKQGINWQTVLDFMGRSKSLSMSLPLTVTAPAPGNLTTFTSKTSDLTLIVQAIETMGKTNTLSSPRLTTSNNEEARLAVATRKPYVSQTVVETTNSTNTADNVQFIDVGVTLTVKPRILADGLIEMKIKPQVSSSTSNFELQSVASGSNTPFTRTSIPIVTTQELETVVTVRSGTTVIVGGLIQDVQDKQSQNPPLLGHLPLVGQVFNSKSNNFTKTELVVFLTPTIVNNQIEVDFENQHERFFDATNTMKSHRSVGDYSGVDTLDSKTLIEPTPFPYWQNKAVATNKAGNEQGQNINGR